MTRHSLSTLFALLLSASTLLAQSGFSTKTYPAAADTQLRVADFNHDGKPDLLGLNPGFNTGDVYLNDGSGGFKAPVALAAPDSIALAKIGDLNGDGFPDIVGCYTQESQSSNFDRIQIFLNDGTGKFMVGQSFGLVDGCASLVIGDVNLDGHLDVVVGTWSGGNNGVPLNNIVQTYYGDGSGKVSATPVTQQHINLDDPGAGSIYTNCVISDTTSGNFLLDNQLSLLVNTSCYGPNNSNLGALPGTTFLGRGAGNGQFTFTESHTATEHFGDSLTADINQDGRPDATFYSIYNPDSGNLFYAQNNSGGSFTYKLLNNNIRSGGGPAPIQFTGDTVADLTGDSINDVAAIYYTEHPGSNQYVLPYISILAGSKNGALAESQHFLISPDALATSGLAAADFNGDGKQDLAVIVTTAGTSPTGTVSPSTSLFVYTNGAPVTAACAAPATTNKNVICAPAAGATAPGPTVTVTAASNVPNLTLNRLYLDNTSVYQVASSRINTTISAATGPHTLVLVSYNKAGQSFTSSTHFTVSASNNGGCFPASGSGVAICSPVAGSTNPASPSTITLTAGAVAQSGNITAIRAYVDNVSVATVNNPGATNSFQVNTPINVTAGNHSLVVIGYQSNGGYVSKSENFSVTTAGPCVPPNGQQGVVICSPSANTTASSPLTVSAGAYQGGGRIYAIRIYLDSIAQATIQNPKTSNTPFSITKSITAAPGKHNLVVVAYPSTGSFSASEMITVP